MEDFLRSSFERRFLPRSMPEYLRRLPYVGILDTYIENDPSRAFYLRQRGSELEMVLTVPTAVPGHAQVYTLPLDIDSFEALCNHKGLSLKGPSLHKLSYYPPMCPWCFDCFLGVLKGLVLVRFWFSSLEEMQSFQAPDFVFQEVTAHPAFSDGMLAGTSYESLEGYFRQYGYVRF